MGGYIAPLVAVFMAASLFATYAHINRTVTPSAYVEQMSASASTFLAYRDAVTSYMLANPSFTGSIPPSSLAVQLPASFFSTGTGGNAAGNFVSAVGSSGRVVTCWASLPPGTAQQAMTKAGIDPSIGTSNGSGWVSLAPGSAATPVALTTPVPAGDVVSVIQIGA